MGNQRLGRLPRTRRWAAVIELLSDSPHETGRVAGATIRAAQHRLDELADESALPYCYWLLTRLTWAARGDDFANAAALLSAPVQPGDSVIDFIAQLSEDIGETLARSPGNGPFAELAIQSFRSTLLDAVAVQGQRLFGSTVEDLQHAFRAHSTTRGFSTLAHHFFGDFIGRCLRYFLDREIGNHIGPACGLSTVDDARHFADAVDLHARETARIVERFAGEWYAKRNRVSDGAISRDEAAAFVGHAMTKIRMELMQEVPSG